MNRRGFLAAILAAGAAPAIVKAANIMPVFVRRESGLLAPEQFVVTAVVDGQPMLANRLLTIDMITNEALRIMHKNMAFVGSMNRTFSDGFKPGDVVTIRRPA